MAPCTSGEEHGASTDARGQTHPNEPKLWPCRYNSSMQITLNGHPRDCGDHLTVTQLLHESGYAGRRVAVEVNLEIVPRSQHDGYVLREGDKVEIVQAIGGG
jgi:sulfur carrier protein